MKKISIALIQPSYYGLGYIDAANARDYEVIAITSSEEDPKKFGYVGKYKDLIVADIRDVDSIISAIDHSPYKNKLNALIPGCSYVTDIAAKVAEHYGLVSVGYEAAYRARYKDETRKAFESAGLLNAKFAAVTNFDEAREAANKIGYPVIVKPTNCDCSQNVTYIKDENDLLDIFVKFRDFKTTYHNFNVRRIFLVEEYVTGPEFSVEIFMYKGEPIFASVTEKFTTEPPYFAELAHVVPTSKNQAKVPILIDCAVKAMKSVGLLNAPSHVEMKLSPRGPIIMEINARQGGDRIAQDLLINAYGINLFDIGLDLYTGLPAKAKPTKKMASAIAFLTVKKAGRVRNIIGLDKVGNMDAIITQAIKLKTGDHVEPPTCSDERYGYLISVAKTPEEAKQIVFNAIDSIKIEYEAQH